MPHRTVLLLVLLVIARESVAAISSEQEQLPKELLPRTFTFSEKGVRVAEALAALSKQTGIEVADRRTSKTGKGFDLECTQVTFWEALDTIAQASKNRIALYQSDGKLALVDGPTGKQPISYHGPFRTAVKRVTVTRELDGGSSTCALTLEFAWEPRLQPFLVDVCPSRILVAENNEAELPEQGRTQLLGGLALEVTLRLGEAPPRQIAALERVSGTLVVTAPNKMLEFTFKKLHGIKPREKAERLQQEGVTVQLTEVTAQRDGWTVEVAIDNPPGGPRFESYQSWLGNNAIWLEKGAGKAKVRLQPTRLEEILALTAERAVIRYRFTHRENPGVSFGEFGDWAMVYRTPGRMSDITVPYQIRDVPLP